MLHLIFFFCYQALEKSKYEQSLESVRRFIAIAEKELELYNRHVALYGDPINRNPLSILDCPRKKESNKPKVFEKEKLDFTCFSMGLSEKGVDSVDLELKEFDDYFKDESLSTGESDSEGNIVFDSDGEASSSETQERSKC